MHLSRPRKVNQSSPDSDGYLNQKDLARLAKACQATSKELQQRLSISSDSSDPGMMYDPFNSSGSDTSFEDLLTRNPSKADLAAMQEENETWDLYWTPAKAHPLQLPIDPCKTSLLVQEPNLSSYNRNFASSNLPSLNGPEGSRDLRRSDALRAARRQNHSSPTPLPLLPRTTYSPFPPLASTCNSKRTQPQLETPLHPTDPQDTQPKSWPTRTSSHPRRTRLPPRSRADTTSSLPTYSNSTPSKFTPTHPSNLSTCTTLDYQSPPDSSSSYSTDSSPLYMRSLSRSPIFLSRGNETSVFDVDDDEDRKCGGLVGSLREKLHIRSASSQDEKVEGFGVEVRQGKKRTRRSLSEVVKGVFRVRKKGGTL